MSSVTFINATRLNIVVRIGSVINILSGATTTPTQYTWPANTILQFYIYELVCPPVVPPTPPTCSPQTEPAVYTPLVASAPAAIAWSTSMPALAPISAGVPIAAYYNAPPARTWTGKVYVSGNADAPIIAVCLNILHVRAEGMGTTDTLSINTIPLIGPGAQTPCGMSAACSSSSVSPQPTCCTFTVPTTVSNPATTVSSTDTFVLNAASGAGGPLTPIPTFSFQTCTGLGSTTPVVSAQPVLYASPAYAWKQALTLTQSVQWHTVTLTLSVPAGASTQLGFQYETFGYPPVSAASASIAGAAFFSTPDGAPTNAPLVPYVPFNIVSATTGKFLTVQGNIDSPTLVWATGPLAPFDAVWATFTFAPCTPATGSTTFQLCSLFGMAAGIGADQLPYPGNVAPLNVGIVDATTAGAFIPSGVMSLADVCAMGGISWGVAPIFNGPTGNAGAVQLLAAVQQTTPVIYYLRSDVDTSGGVALMQSRSAAGAQLTAPTGFITLPASAPAGAVRLCLLSQAATCQLLTTPSLLGNTYASQYCNEPSVFGCGSGPAAVPTCTLGTTQSGAAFCNSNQLCAGVPPAGDAEVQAAKQFVASTCLSSYTSAEGYACMPIGGTPTTSCVGWGVPFLASQCNSACELITSFDPTWCDNMKMAYCNAPANVNTPACACINVANSSFPVAINRGLSFPAFQQELISSYGLLDSTQLFPQCWWGACDVNSGALTLDARDCPDYIIDCQTVIKNIVGGAGTTININQACSSASGSSSVPPNPCSSFGTLHQRLKQQQRSAFSALTPAAPFQTWDYVAVIGTACVVLLGIGLCAAFITRYVKQKQSSRNHNFQ